MLQENLRQGPPIDSPAALARKLDELYGGVESPFGSGPSLYGGGGMSPNANPPAPPAPEEEDKSFLETAGGVLGDLGASVVRGAAGAVNETTSFLGGLVGIDNLNLISEDILPEEREGALYGFVEGAAQFAVGMAGAGKFLKLFHLGRKGYAAARALGASRQAALRIGRGVTPALAGALTDFAAFDPYEDRLSNLLENSLPEFSNPVTQFLAADEEDPELLSRAKASLEGVLLGSTIDGILRGIRAVRINRLRKAGRLTDEEAAAKIQEIANEPATDDDIFDYLVDEAGEPVFIIKKDIENFTPSPEEFIARSIDKTRAIHEASAESLKADLAKHYNPEEDTLLWHATVSKSGVMDEGLLSSMELGGVQALGGSESPSPYVSVTWKRDHAYYIASFHKANIRASRGELTDWSEYISVYAERSGWETPREINDQSIWYDLQNSEAVMDYAIEKAGASPWEADEVIDEFMETIQNDWGAFTEALNALSTELSPEEAHSIVNALDALLPEGKRAFSDQLPEQLAQFDPEDVGVVQVLVRKGAEPTFIKPEENELQFRSTDIEVLERITLRDQMKAEMDLAALNLNFKKLRPAADDVATRQEMIAGLRKFRERIEAGADPRDPETWQGLGMNTNWLVGQSDLESLIRAVEEAGEEKIWWYVFKQEAGAGVPNQLTHEQATEIVQEFLGPRAKETPSEFARRFHTDMQGAAKRVVAGRIFTVLLGQDVIRLSNIIDGMPNPSKVHLDMLDAALSNFVDLNIQLRGASSEIARALQAHKIKIGSSGEFLGTVGASDVAEAAEDGFKKLGLTDRQKRALARELRLTGGDPDSILDALRHTFETATENPRNPGFWDKVLGFRTNMLLSGPKTHVVNIVNNVVASIQVPFERWWAGKRSGNEALAQQGLDMLPTIEDIRETLAAVRKTWKLGKNIIDPAHAIDEGTTSDSIASWFGTSAKWLDRLITLPGRALMAGDEFFKQMNYRAHVRSQALRLGREDAARRGLKPGTKEYSEFLTERIQEQMEVAFIGGRGRNPLALEHARYTTFSNSLEYGVGKWLQDGANKYPFIRLILPFVRTPVNIVRFGWQRTPILNRLQRQWREDLAAGGERAAYAKARTEVGIALYGTGALLALQGMITGGGPSNPQLRKQWLDAGNQPYAIRLPDGTTIQYQRLEPLATPLALIADGVEAWGELDQEDAEDIVFASVGALASSLSSKTFLFGLSDFFDAVGRGETYAVRRYITNLTTSFTPNFLAQINADGVYREARSILDAVRARTPGLSDKLEPRRNLFGEPVLKPPVLFQRVMNPFTVMVADEDDATFAKLVELGRALPMPSATRFGGAINLADREKYDNGTGQSPYDRMFEIVSNPSWGPPLRKALASFVNSPMWDQLGDGSDVFPGGGKYEVARQIVAQYYQAAYKQVLAEYPALRAEIVRLGGLRASGLLAALSE